MAVIASDTFGGLGDGTSLGGRTLDNGAGGSGTRAWASIASANLVGNGSGQVRGTSNARNNRVQIAGLVNHKIRARFTPNGSHSSICLVSRCTNGENNGGSDPFDALYAVLASSGTSLIVREGVNQGWAAGSNRASKTITAVDVGGWYWLELEVNALVVTARVLNDNLSLYDEVSHTFGALPAGTFYGLGFALSGNAALFDDFLIEDLEGGGAPPPQPGRARAMWI